MRTLLVAVLLGALAAPAQAQIVLTQLQWHLLPSQKAGRKKAVLVNQITRPPSEAAAGEAIGAIVTLRNESARPVVGVLLRYAVTAQIAPLGDRTKGTWTVPFWLEEARIPQLGAGKETKFTIRNLHLESYMKKLLREGYWPISIKVQVMAEPKTGEELARKMAEAELGVQWERQTP